MDWIFESQNGYKTGYKIKKILYKGRSEYQEITVAESYDFGRLLFLDNAVMLTERFEFIYHEAISHIPLFTHPAPENVLIIGGGDGGTLREVLKHKTVKKVDLVEIDKKVIEVSKKYFKNLSKSFNNPKANVIIMDGVKFVEITDKKYDAILIDSADPIGPAKVLFGKNFYKNCYKILKDDGILVTQAESPLFMSKYFKSLFKIFNTVFEITMPYIVPVPDYPFGLWGFMLGSKKYHPLKDLNEEKTERIETKFYNKDIHKSVFQHPNFVKRLLK